MSTSPSPVDTERSRVGMRLRIMRQIVALTLLALAVVTTAPAAEPTGSVRGQVVVTGMDRYTGVAALWRADTGRPPDPRRYVLIPAANRPLLEDGRFEIQAPAGHYYLGVIVRDTPGPAQGPPRPGDRVFLSPDRTGASREILIKAGENLETGRHEDSWVFTGMQPAGDGPRVSGVLCDQDGRPVGGLLVFAFTDPAMSEEPLAVSTPSGPDGRFTLAFDRPATVYLRARDHYGPRHPSAGGRMGVYGGATALAVAVGETRPSTDIRIVIHDIPPLSERQDSPRRPDTVDKDP